jgi:hypothetical protein
MEKLEEVMLVIIGSCEEVGIWPWKMAQIKKLRKGGD